MTIGERIRFIRNLRGMTQITARVPSRELSDAMINALRAQSRIDTNLDLYGRRSL